jgi:hypothetical protein
LKPGTIILACLAAHLAAQPPPPGGAEGVRNRLARVTAEGPASKEMLTLAQFYLDRSDAARRGSPFAAARYLASADALMHAAEHQQHSAQKSGPEPPDGPEINRHLDRVYFRLQQADFFVKQSADPRAQTIAGLARQFYQDALRALDRRETRSADENAKTVDELMRALENLAQATAPPGRP